LPSPAGRRNQQKHLPKEAPHHEEEMIKMFSRRIVSAKDKAFNIISEMSGCYNASIRRRTFCGASGEDVF
jgi:hypothetical protein